MTYKDIVVVITSVKTKLHFPMSCQMTLDVSLPETTGVTVTICWLDKEFRILKMKTPKETVRESEGSLILPSRTTRGVKVGRTTSPV